MHWILAIVLFSVVQGFSQDIEIFGHRGWRGQYPENSIEGFNEALHLPIEGIEWDVVVNADSQLVLSHEPYFHPKICCLPDQLKGRSRDNNLFLMTQGEIQLVPCGCKAHPDFPEQQTILYSKPLLKDVLEKCHLQGKTVLFEIKSNEKEYGVFQPFPKEYARIILRETEDIDSSVELIFMSFDPAILNALHELNKESRKILLVYRPIGKISNTLAPLQFKPEGIACLYLMLNKKSIQQIQSQKMKCLAWTVNSVKRAKKLKRWNIDGIITDYPDILQQINLK
jgi:glycerophosphoryl diester phosphodiesterase